MQSEETMDLTVLALNAVRKIVQALRQSSRRAEQDLGISGAQLFVLSKLFEAESPLSLGDIAARTHTHPSSVSVVVGKLVDRGFILRSTAPDDARRLELKLSPKGRAFLAKSAPRTAQEDLAEAIDGLGPSRAALFVELLTEVIESAGFDSAETNMFFEDGPS